MFIIYGILIGKVVPKRELVSWSLLLWHLLYPMISITPSSIQYMRIGGLVLLLVLK